MLIQVKITDEQAEEIRGYLPDKMTVAVHVRLLLHEWLDKKRGDRDFEKLAGRVSFLERLMHGDGK